MYVIIISIILNVFVLVPKPPAAAAKDKGKLPAFFFFYLNKIEKKIQPLLGGRTEIPPFSLASIIWHSNSN